MSEQASLNVRLFGTEEVPQPAREICAGALSVVLQNGSLRYISIGGREALRGIAFVVRDKDWGTYIPDISDLEIESSDEDFRIRYEATCRDDSQEVIYSAAIEGLADGSLHFVVTGKASTPFLTSRAGFVVLHPIDGVAGAPVTVTHTDGSTEQSRFPSLIRPSQPFMDIRALRHEIAPGITVTCTMEGDAFEMEDQRNWTDGSYKTYIRPLAKPHPFTLEPDRDFVQRVDLATDGKVEAPRGLAVDDSVTVKVMDDTLGLLPDLALAVHPDYASESLHAAELVRRSNVRHLFCTFDASAGHDVVAMAQFKQLGKQTGTSLVLEAVLPLRDGEGQFTDDVEVLNSDISNIRNAADEAGVTFSMISASPECYLKSYQPSGPWPNAPTLERVYAKVKEAFPDTAIAAGMHSFFTELNRFPPPTEIADVITHSTCPIVHAGDDISVMETLQALPWIFASARELGDGKPYWIGPTAIGMRFNPYGNTTMPNPDNVRGAMVTIDPRQRGLLNAAWTLGYIARAAAGGVDGLCLSAVAGPFGIVWQKMDWRQPWFDEIGAENALFPVYHVIAGLAGRRGASVRSLECSDPSHIAALAIDADEGRELWLANLTAARRHVVLEGFGWGLNVQRLDSESFAACCLDPDGFLSTSTPTGANSVEIDAYAILRIQ